MGRFVLNASMWAVAMTAMLATPPSVRAESEAELPAVPDIVCEEPVYDFGRADAGSLVSHTWVVENRGGAPLHITRVQPGCGCTAARPSRERIPPGEQAQIEATLSLKNRRGGQKKWVLVESNDPDTPALTLWFQGVAYEPLQVTPGQVAFGRLAQTPRQSRTVQIKAGTGETLHITEIDTGVSYLEAEREALEDERQFNVHLRTLPPLPEGTSEAVVEVKTDSDKYPVIEIPVTLSSGLELVVAPKRLQLAPTDADEVTREILVGAPGIESFNIRRVMTPDPAMRYMIVRLRPNQYRVTIKGIRPRPELDQQVVHISTDLQEQRQISVPIEYRPR